MNPIITIFLNKHAWITYCERVLEVFQGISGLACHLVAELPRKLKWHEAFLTAVPCDANLLPRALANCRLGMAPWQRGAPFGVTC
jgi:hypothetical protein